MCILCFKDNPVDLILSKSMDRALVISIWESEKKKEAAATLLCAEKCEWAYRRWQLFSIISFSPPTPPPLIYWNKQIISHHFPVVPSPIVQKLSPRSLLFVSLLCFSTHSQFWSLPSALMAFLSHSLTKIFWRRGPSLQKAQRLSAAFLYCRYQQTYLTLNSSDTFPLPLHLSLSHPLIQKSRTLSSSVLQI